MKTILLMLTMFVGVNANAQLLSSLNFNQKWEMYGIDVANDVDYNTLKLKLTGVGLASKKVGIAKVKVFVVQVFTQYPDKFIRTETEALGSVKDVGYTTIRLTFVRGIDSTMVGDAINEYLNNNIPSSEYPLYKNDIDVVLGAISGDESFTYGSSITIVGYKNHILYEDTKGKVTTINSTNADLTTKMMAMFLGIVTNNEGYSLKMQLLEEPTTTFGSLK